MRAGSAAARSLFLSDDAGAFETAISAYDAVLCALAQHKKKPHLPALDRWWRTPPADFKLTRASLIKCAEFKLTRGPMRPLLPLVRSNSDDAVAAAWSAASNAADVGSAVELLAALRGVGPATASFILAAYSPARFPAMADEVIEGAGLDRKYDLPTYKKMATALTKKALQLGGEWTAELVGRAMWSTATASALGLCVGEKAAVHEGESAKRKVASNSETPTTQAPPRKSRRRGRGT